MSLAAVWIFSILLFVQQKDYVVCDLIPDNNNNAPSLYCTDLNPQNSVDIEQILGMWYGNEIITHHDTMTGEIAFDACVVIHLAEITHEISTTRPRRPDSFDEYHNRQIIQYGPDNQRVSGPQYYHYLRLIWSEQETNLEYTLRYNTTRRGFWISSAPQKGTMLKLNYGQFSGTIQVMKAVGNHMVLTFCESLPGSQLFSIVLSRKANMLTNDDLQSVRSLLKRRGLSTASVRKVCNGASTPMQSISIMSLIVSTVIAFIFNKF